MIFLDESARVNWDKLEEYLKRRSNKMQSIFREDKEGYTVWWIEGGANDCNSVSLTFMYNPWLSAWQCDIREGRTARKFDVNSNAGVVKWQTQKT